jgi:hypothetical protein
MLRVWIARGVPSQRTESPLLRAAASGRVPARCVCRNPGCVVKRNEGMPLKVKPVFFVSGVTLEDDGRQQDAMSTPSFQFYYAKSFVRLYMLVLH